MLRNGETAGAGNHRTNLAVAELLHGAADQKCQRLLDIRKMPLVIGEEDFPVVITNRNFDSGGTDIHTHA